jgi:hypothetical protein
VEAGSFRTRQVVRDPVSSPQFAGGGIEAIHQPCVITQGQTAVDVTVKGVNFVRRSVVYFNGKPVPTHVYSSTALAFTLDSEAMKAAGRFRSRRY